MLSWFWRFLLSKSSALTLSMIYLNSMARPFLFVVIPLSCEMYFSCWRLILNSCLRIWLQSSVNWSLTYAKTLLTSWWIDPWMSRQSSMIISVWRLHSSMSSVIDPPPLYFISSRSFSMPTRSMYTLSTSAFHSTGSNLASNICSSSGFSKSVPSS